MLVIKGTKDIIEKRARSLDGKPLKAIPEKKTIQEDKPSSTSRIEDLIRLFLQLKLKEIDELKESNKKLEIALSKKAATPEIKVEMPKIEQVKKWEELDVIPYRDRMGVLEKLTIKVVK